MQEHQLKGMNMIGDEGANELSETDACSKKLCERLISLVAKLKNKIKYSADELVAAGFECMNDGKTIKCNECGLVVTENSRRIDLYKYHQEQSADCRFILSTEVMKKRLKEDDGERVVKRLKTDCDRYSLCSSRKKYFESKLVQEARVRSFSHWNKNARPTKEQMMAAGFFQCNVGDRIICLYCNLIAQQWTDGDDPLIVHSTLSPNCCYVRTMLDSEESSSVCIVNENETNMNDKLLASGEIVCVAATHPEYATITSRETTFNNWDTSLLPAVNDLVEAGFFYGGSSTITTCFYCGGSLHNWEKKDQPIVEHIRWFSACKYARQFAGDEVFNQIQEARRARKAREAAVAQTENNNTNQYTASVNHQLHVPDERTLSRLVAARLDLPVSQRLLDNPFKLSVIKRCWEDQLRLKHDDFTADCDLYIACSILQKQIDHINGNKDNITIPSVRMKQIRDGINTDNQLNESVKEEKNQLTTTTESSTDSMTVENNSQQNKINETEMEATVALNNPCVLCWKEEKRLACIPCGHLVACSNCHKNLRTCPICRRGVEAFVRVYL